MNVVLQIIAALLAIAALAAAFKMAIILLVVAGLIFRTKETLGLLAIGGIINGFTYHPWISIGLAVALLSIGTYLKHKEKQKPSTTATVEAIPQLPA